MTTSRLLLAIALLAALTACELGGRETRTGAGAACSAVAAACTQSSDCCSYGCISGTCVANPAEGGACRTTNDCASGRLCKSGACTTPTAGMCRDTADVCTSYLQCCSGNCEGASCTQNNAPLANAGPTDVANVPYRTLYTLQSTSTDPDGDPLSWGWSFVAVPPGSAATISGASLATATFTPDQVGTYQVKLVVTDGPTGAPNRLTSETTIVIHVVNRAPEPTATAGGATCAGAPLSCSRNNLVHVTATASDPDGDALECAWRITEPGGQPTLVAAFAACANPSSASLDYTPTWEGTYSVEYVVRDHDQTSGAIVHGDVPALAAFVSRNDPPVPALSRSPYYANVSGPGPVALDARGSSDLNRDVISFAWEPLTWPGQGTGAAAPVLDTTATGLARFTPAAEGDYTVLLTVSDPPLTSPAPVGVRPSTSSTLTATVHVARAVQDFGPGVEVVDADVAHGVGTSGIVVIAGPNPSNAAQGMLWKLDLANRTLTAVTATPLGQAPIAVGVSPDGTVAVVASTSYLFHVPLDGSAWSSVGAPFAVSDVVVSGDQGGGKHVAYVFPASTINTVRILDLANDTLSSTTVYGQKGALNQAASRLYVREPSYVYKYSIGGNGALGASGWGTYTKSCMSLWTPRPTTETHIFTGCGDVVAVNTSSLTLLPETLASTSIAHLDTAADGSGVYVGTGGQSILRFDPYLAPVAADALPHWSWDGLNRAASGLFVFTNGTSRWAIVQGSPGGTTRFGLVTFP